MRSCLQYGILCVLIVICGEIKAQPGGVDENVIISTDGTKSAADSSSLYIIREITISGNEKTRPATILREIPFEINKQYSLDAIEDQFYEARRHLMNTGLFRNVVVSLNSIRGADVSIHVDVEERWYIYPLPFVRPIDNSFYAWATQQDRDFERLNYGVRISHNNFTGRNDRLFLYLMNGYTKKVELNYQNLFLDRAMQWYATFNMQYGKNREVIYNTVDNKQLPLKAGNDYLQSFFRSMVTINYRKAIRTRHTFGLGFEHRDVADSVYSLNPEFAPTRGSVQYMQAFYRLAFTDLDFIPYPTKGYASEFTLSKKGFNDPVDMWQFMAKSSAYWPVGDRNFFNLRLAGMIKLPLRQPYINQQFLGHDGMFLQGYENYTIDGVAGGYAKASFTRPVFSSVLKLPSQKFADRFDRYSTIPFRVFARAFVNAGYIHHTYQNSLLNNRPLVSGGLGIDIVTFTDFVIRLEWSLNQLGQNGIYLHPRNNF